MVDRIRKENERNLTRGRRTVGTHRTGARRPGATTMALLRSSARHDRQRFSTVCVGLERIGSAGNGGAMAKARLGNGMDSRLRPRDGCGGWLPCGGGGSYEQTGVSTRCARPPLALRPWRVTRRPALRSKSSCGPCGPTWTEASRPSMSSHHRTRDEQPALRLAVRGPRAPQRPRTRGLLGWEGIQLGPYPTHTSLTRFRSSPTRLVGERLLAQAL